MRPKLHAPTSLAAIKANPIDMSLDEALTKRQAIIVGTGDGASTLVVMACLAVACSVVLTLQ